MNKGAGNTSIFPHSTKYVLGELCYPVNIAIYDLDEAFMGYYMRYISTHSPALTIQHIAESLLKQDPKFKIIQSPIESTRAEVLYDELVLGELELNLPDDGIFDEDIEALKEMIEGVGDPNEQRILETLHRTQFIVAISAIWEGKDSAPVLTKLDILWDWLFDNYNGLLQADNEGFYDGDDLILEIHLKI